MRWQAPALAAAAAFAFRLAHGLLGGVGVGAGGWDEGGGDAQHIGDVLRARLGLGGPRSRALSTLLYTHQAEFRAISVRDAFAGGPLNPPPQRAPEPSSPPRKSPLS